MVSVVPRRKTICNCSFWKAPIFSADDPNPRTKQQSGGYLLLFVPTVFMLVKKVKHVLGQRMFLPSQHLDRAKWTEGLRLGIGEMMKTEMLVVASRT